MKNKKAIDNKNNNSFRRHLEKNRKIVQSWPKWKQNALGYKNPSLELGTSKRDS